MDCQLSLIQETARKYQACHDLEIEFLQRAIFYLTWNVIQLKAGIEGALAAAIPSIPKEQTDLMDWEFIPPTVTVSDLAIDLERQIKKGKRTLTPIENAEDKADQVTRARRGGTVPPSTTGAALGPTENTCCQRSTTLTNTASGGSGGGAPPKPPKRSANGGNPDDSFDNSVSNPSDNNISKKGLWLKWITRLMQISLDFGKLCPATLHLPVHLITPKSPSGYIDFAQLLSVYFGYHPDLDLRLSAL